MLSTRLVHESEKCSIHINFTYLHSHAGIAYPMNHLIYSTKTASADLTLILKILARKIVHAIWR